MSRIWQHQKGVCSLVKKTSFGSILCTLSIITGFWWPLTNKNQFWQVDLGRRIPIYAIKLRGDLAYQQLVETYRIRYSNDNATFFEAKTIDGKTYV
jgi:F5/8 type C domain